MTDLALARAIVDLEVPRFEGITKNKGDSVSCQFEPRRLLSDAGVLDHVGRELARVARESCKGSAIVGMATSGIAWAALAGVFARLPVLYIRKQIEPSESLSLIEGIAPPDRHLILVDDLLFAGESKRLALRRLRDHGYTVTDVIVVVDRQLQRKADGPSLQDEFGVRLHALITMEQIVAYMRSQRLLPDARLAALVRDYRRFERWCMPAFAREGQPSGCQAGVFVPDGAGHSILGSAFASPKTGS